MTKSILLALSIALNVSMGANLAKLENIRHGSLIGLCIEDTVRNANFEDAITRVEYYTCLDGKQSRTNDLYHIAYAIGLL